VSLILYQLRKFGHIALIYLDTLSIEGVLIRQGRANQRRCRNHGRGLSLLPRLCNPGYIAYSVNKLSISLTSEKFAESDIDRYITQRRESITSDCSILHGQKCNIHVRFDKNRALDLR